MQRPGSGWPFANPYLGQIGALHSDEAESHLVSSYSVIVAATTGSNVPLPRGAQRSTSLWACAYAAMSRFLKLVFALRGSVAI